MASAVNFNLFSSSLQKERPADLSVWRQEEVHLRQQMQVFPSRARFTTPQVGHREAVGLRQLPSAGAQQRRNQEAGPRQVAERPTQQQPQRPNPALIKRRELPQKADAVPDNVQRPQFHAFPATATAVPTFTATLSATKSPARPAPSTPVSPARPASPLGEHVADEQHDAALTSTAAAATVSQIT